MNIRPRSALLLATVGVLGTVLAGCQAAPAQPDNSSSAESTEDGTAGPDASITGHARPPGCDLAPAALIKSTLGMNLREPTESFDDTEIDCTYVPVQANDLTILLRFRVGQDHASFVTYRNDFETNGQPTTDLTDVGDEAYYSTTESGTTITHTVAARQGSVVVTVGAPTSLDSLKNLIRQILAALA